MTKLNGSRILEVKNNKIKSSVVRKILYGLPDWFGISEYIEKYAKESADKPFYVYYLNDKPIGFLAIKKRNQYSAEIYVMTVECNYHRHISC